MVNLEIRNQAQECRSRACHFGRLSAKPEPVEARAELSRSGLALPEEGRSKQRPYKSRVRNQWDYFGIASQRHCVSDCHPFASLWASAYLVGRNDGGKYPIIWRKED